MATVARPGGGGGGGTGAFPGEEEGCVQEGEGEVPFQAARRRRGASMRAQRDRRQKLLTPP